MHLNRKRKHLFNKKSGKNSATIIHSEVLRYHPHYYFPSELDAMMENISTKVQRLFESDAVDAYSGDVLMEYIRLAWEYSQSLLNEQQEKNKVDIRHACACIASQKCNIARAIEETEGEINAVKTQLEELEEERR